MIDDKSECTSEPDFKVVDEAMNVPLLKAQGSFAFYQELSKFLGSDFDMVRKFLLSRFFSRTEFCCIKRELSNAGINFSQEFFNVLECARSLFHEQQAVRMLEMMCSELDSRYQPCKCIVVTKNVLNEGQKAEIEQKIIKLCGSLRFEYKVDENMIGGIVFKIGQSYYDGSFNKILLNMKRNIIQDLI